MAGVWPVLTAEPSVGRRGKFFIMMIWLSHASRVYLTPHDHLTLMPVVCAGFTVIYHGDIELVLLHIYMLYLTVSNLRSRKNPGLDRMLFEPYISPFRIFTPPDH